MTSLDWFRHSMAQRKRWPRGSMDFDAWTRAARKYLWMHRGIPVVDWPE